MKPARNRQYHDIWKEESWPQCVSVSGSYPQCLHHINYNKTMQYSGAFNYKKKHKIVSQVCICINK